MDCGAPTRTRTADLLITNYMASVFIGFHQYSFHSHIPLFSGIKGIIALHDIAWKRMFFVTHM